MTTPSGLTELGQLEPIPLPPLPAEPLVSVLMCNYNYAGYIGEAIESVIGQTWSKWELIICDDGSTDSSREVIAHYAALDQRIQVVEKQNGGQASAFNAAYEKCSGQIVTLLDSDDRYDLNKMEVLIANFRKNPLSGIATHQLRLIDSKGKPTGFLSSLHLRDGWFAEDMIRSGESGLTPSSGLAFRSEVISLVMPIPQSLRICADGYLATSTVLLSPIVANHEPLAEYRGHDDNSFHSSWPSAKSYVKITEWQALYISGMKEFAQRHFGPGIAAQIDVDNHSAYNAILIKHYLLTGKWPPKASQKSMAERLDNLRGNATTSTIWRTLVKLPRFIAVPIFLLWQGQYPLKRFIPAWIRRPLHRPIRQSHQL
jgi:glycosyltransferase involved in cell wall biosynthesis